MGARGIPTNIQKYLWFIYIFCSQIMIWLQFLKVLEIVHVFDKRLNEKINLYRHSLGTVAPTNFISVCVCLSVCLCLYVCLSIPLLRLTTRLLWVGIDQTWWKCWNLSQIDCIKLHKNRFSFDVIRTSFLFFLVIYKGSNSALRYTTLCKGKQLCCAKLWHKRQQCSCLCVCLSVRLSVPLLG